MPSYKAYPINREHKVMEKLRETWIFYFLRELEFHFLIIKAFELLIYKTILLVFVFKIYSS